MVIGRLSENYNPGDVVQEVLVSDNAVVVVRHDHPLVAAEGLQLLDLLDWNWILPPKETNLRYQIDRSFREEGLSSPLPSVESVSPLINRGLLLQADYLSVLPAQVARNEVGVGQLAILPVRLRSTEGWLGITVLPHARLSPAAEHFLAALRETAKGMQRIPQSTIPSAHV